MNLFTKQKIESQVQKANIITKGQRETEKNKLGLICTHYWHAAVHGVAKSQTQLRD